jgi:hypothetical protein
MDVSSKLLHKEISISTKFLHDFPNSMITSFVIETEVNNNVLIFGARYPILLIKSLEISVL